jgi:hypothetical protein
MMNKINSMTLNPFGGLANRIYAITSSIGFCEKNNRKLKVIWFKDWGMGADFHRLFTLPEGAGNVEVVDAKNGIIMYMTGPGERICGFHGCISDCFCAVVFTVDLSINGIMRMQGKDLCML